MEQIRLKTGEFKTFTATRSFALGNFNVRIENGTDLEFDGSTVKYAGADYAFPQLRGALKAGWIVLADSYDSENEDYGRPASARIQVHSATQGDQPKSMIATVSQDEHIVMNSRTHTSNTKSANRRTASQSGSDGIAVRTLKTPAVSATNVTQAQSVISALDNLKITPGQGMTVDEMMDRMTDEERETYLIKKEAHRSNYVNDADTKSGSGKTVGKVRSTQGTKTSEGMTVTSSTGGGIETWDGGQAEEVVANLGEKNSTVVEDGIKFSNTGIAAKPVAKKQTGKPAAAPMSAEVRLRIAKAVCPDFPDSYDFAATDRKKLARLQADFEDNLEVLRAVFAAEGDDFRAQLVQEFPQVFA